jgi:hypothetical protein
MALERPYLADVQLPGKRMIMPPRPPSCEFCGDTGLVSNGRIPEHGGEVEHCFEGCVSCETGKEMRRSIEILRAPRKTEYRQRRAS